MKSLSFGTTGEKPNSEKDFPVVATPPFSQSMKRILYVVECPHFGVYASGFSKSVAESICKGCCPDARVVEYVPK